MITITEIKDGYLVTEEAHNWKWWVYPDDHEIRNNGERYTLMHEQVAPRIDLPVNWTLGDVINQVINHRPTGRKGGRMKIEKVNGSFCFTCKKCNVTYNRYEDRRKPATEIYADLDGPSFEAYYCPKCAEIIRTVTS